MSSEGLIYYYLNRLKYLKFVPKVLTNKIILKIMIENAHLRKRAYTCLVSPLLQTLNLEIEELLSWSKIFLRLALISHSKRGKFLMPLKINKESSPNKKNVNELINKMKYVKNKARNTMVVPISKQSIMNLDYLFVSTKPSNKNK